LAKCFFCSSYLALLTAETPRAPPASKEKEPASIEKEPASIEKDKKDE
jgi:hypothetical protein